MKLLFKQKFFSWFDSYDVFDEAGNVQYTVRGELSWGHLLRIYDAAGREVGSVREKVFTWLPRFEIYLGDRQVGSISKEFTFFHPKFNIDYNGWQVDGDWAEWDYEIRSSYGQPVATISKELHNAETVNEPCCGIHGIPQIICSIYCFRLLYIGGFCAILSHRQCLSDVIIVWSLLLYISLWALSFILSS